MPAVSVTSDHVGSSLLTATDLPRVPTQGLRDGDLAYLATPNQYWRLDKASTVAVSAITAYADIALYNAANAGRWVFFSSGSGTLHESQDNIDQAALATTTTGQQVGPALAKTPVYQGVTAGTGSYVTVTMDGVEYPVGDGVTTKEFYFAAPGSLGVAKNIRNIVAGDVLVRGSALLIPTDTNDRLSYHYLCL